MVGAKPATALEEVEAQERTLRSWLRDWEKRFAAAHGRAPEKDDVRSNARIKERYQRLGRIKAERRRLLENPPQEPPQLPQLPQERQTPPSSPLAPSARPEGGAHGPVAAVAESPVQPFVRRLRGSVPASPVQVVPASPDVRPLGMKRKIGGPDSPAAVETTPKRASRHASIDEEEAVEPSPEAFKKRLVQSAVTAQPSRRRVRSAAPLSPVPELRGVVRRAQHLGRRPAPTARLVGVLKAAPPVAQRSQQQAGHCDSPLKRACWQASACESPVEASPQQRNPAVEASPLAAEMPIAPSRLKKQLFTDEPAEEAVRPLGPKAAMPPKVPKPSSCESACGRPPTAPMPVLPKRKVRQELTQNFVRLDMRSNRWKAKHKGGNAASRVRRERRDFNRPAAGSGTTSSAAAVHRAARQDQAMDDVLAFIGEKKAPEEAAAAAEGAPAPGLGAKEAAAAEKRKIKAALARKMAAASKTKKGATLSAQEKHEQQAEAAAKAKAEADEMRLASLAAPLCPGHQQPCRVARVNKKNRNCGRLFYVCGVGTYSWKTKDSGGCNFFMWVDDSSGKVKETARAGEQSSEQFAMRRLEDAHKHLQGQSVAQLKQQLRRHGLPLGGKKDDLVQRLLACAEQQIREGDSYASAFARAVAQERGDGEGEGEDHIADDSADDGSVSASDEEHEEEEPIEAAAAAAEEEEEEEEESKEGGSESASDSEAEVQDAASVSASEDEAKEEPRPSKRKTRSKPKPKPKPRHGPAGVVHKALREVFGFEAFRGEQEWAISRVLEGKSTLLVQATGSGKSLCYQLPALLLPGLTIVVSPLVSLMMDQANSLPAALPGACLTGQQTGVEIARTIKALRERRIKVLFLSPERLFSSSFQRLVRTPGMLPEVSLVCVDEAHCISAWSHNFRPSYLRLRELLAATSGGSSGERHDLACLNPRCVLALTATATSEVVTDMCSVLGIDGKEGTKVGCWRRANLEQRALFLPESGRQKALTALLTEEGELAKVSSVIVYVRTKMETEATAEHLRSYRLRARAYHGGMSAADRHMVQSGFMKGTYTVVVATIAFGMGIDKEDIRGVVHVGLPRSVEDYVQGIGRAGRDGKPALCVTLFDDNDARRLHSLAFSDSVSKLSLLRMLRMLAKRASQERIAIEPDTLAASLDAKPAVLETLLVYLSLPPFSLLRLLPSGYAQVAVRPLRAGAPELDASVAYRAIRAHAMAEGEPADLVAAAATAGATVPALIRALSGLQDAKLVALTFSAPAAFVQITRALEDGAWADVEDIAERLVTKGTALETNQLRKVEAMFALAVALSEEASLPERLRDELADAGGGGRAAVGAILDEYFAGGLGAPRVAIPFPEEAAAGNTALVGDLKALLRDRKFREACPVSPSTLAMARILHAVPSPAFPREAWASHPLWGRHAGCRLPDLLSLARSVVEVTRS